MIFSVTEDGVYFLYPYYSYSEKIDEKSKMVYQVFKKAWNMDSYFPLIKEDLLSAVKSFIIHNQINPHRIAITIMPSHSKGQYGEGLLKLAEELAWHLNCKNASGLIQRITDKVKSTDGGERTVDAHLRTLGLATYPDNSIKCYIILDDITTTGSSLEAAKQLLISNGVKSGRIVKIAVAKTMHE